MCNQVRVFTVGFRKFIAKIQMTFPNCADINLCLHSYLLPSQTELKVIGHLLGADWASQYTSQKTLKIYDKFTLDENPYSLTILNVEN